MTIRIAMWSGPRNISTAMMRSFGARSDCAVSDEPFYGCYLRESGEPQPMADAIIEDMDTDWHSVADTLRGPAPGGAAVWYQKHMPHHMVGPVSVRDFPDHRHAFLIREPERVIASYARKRVEVKFSDLRYDRQLSYFQWVKDQLGKPPPVVDSSQFLADPAGHLDALCCALEIPFDAGMTSWEPGFRETDGIWATHWYDAVAASSGFDGTPGPLPQLDGDAAKLAAECRPLYEAIAEHALSPA